MIYPANKDEKTMINLTVVIDNDEAVKKLKELQNVAKTTTSSVVKDSERMDASWQQMKNSLMSLTAGVSFAALAKQVVQVRGEVQQLEVAFETMLGSKEKADTLMTEIIDLAAKTPFGLQDVSNATKMLLAYGSTAEQVTDEIKMLGNIASGLSIPLNDMIYLYGTTRTQGRMFTQDLRQFMGRGIPIAEELAKQFGVTKDKVGELVTAGKVGFDEVAKALQAMTSEGGKFNNLMDKQSQTIAGQISNLEDAIYQMFNEIGESSEGVISDLISGASWVVEHYQEILNVLKYVIAAYGSYRAALILVAGAQKALALAEATAGLLKMTSAARGLSIALKGLTAAAGPIGMIVSVLGIAVTAFTSYNKKTEEATKQMGKLEKAAYDEYIEVNRLVGRLHDANLTESERNSILNRLKTVAPDILQGISDEANMTEILTANLKKYNDEKVREIQLKSITDSQNEALKVRADAEMTLGGAKLNASNAVSDIMAKLNLGNLDIKSRSIGDFRKISDNEAKQIKYKFEKEILAILNSSADDITKLSKIINLEVLTNPDGRGGYRRSKLQGFGGVADIKEIISGYNDATTAYNNADKAVEELTKKNEALAEVLGISGDKVKDSTENVLTYAEAYKAAQKNYIDTQKALADAEKNKSNYTEQQYKEIKDRADAAKKAYQELGGVTSTKAQTEQEKQAKEAAKLAKQLQYDADQATIDAMVEGTDKKVAQIELDYKKRKDAIQQQEADLMAKQGGTLTDDQRKLFGSLHEGNADAYADAMNVAIFGDTDALAKEAFDRVKAEKDAWNEYLVEYGTFKERVKAITIKYNKAIADADTEAERKVLEAERDALLAEYKAQASDWAKSLVDMTTAQLNKMLAELQAQVEAKEQAFNALESSDSEDAQKYRDEINKLKAQIAVLNNELGKTARQATDKDWDESVQTFQEIARAANEAADGIAEFDEDLGNSLRSIAQLASTGLNLVVVIKKITDAAWTGAAAISAMEKASLILAAISAAIQVVSALFNLFRQSDEVEQTKRQFKELNDELERLHKLARIDSVEGTIFGPNPFGNFINNLKAMQDALKDFEASKEAIRNKDVQYMDVVAGWNADGSAVTQKVPQGRQNLNDAISNMQVMTKHKTWFSDREYADLGDLMPDLFDEFGNVTLEGLQNLQNSDEWEKLGEKDRELIEQMIADWEDYNAAVEATEKYLSDVFGDLGYTMTNALVDAFENGTDAAQAFGEAASDVIEKLATDMIHAALVQPILDKYQLLIDEANLEEMSPEERIAELTRLIGEMSQEVLAVKGEVDATAAQVRQDAEDAGITGVYDGNYSASASSKGFQTMSQETGSELNGRFTDIQGQTHRIAEAVEFCKSLHIDNLTQVQSINATVALIHNDTSLIASHTRALAQMQKDIASIRRSIDDGAI